MPKRRTYLETINKEIQKRTGKPNFASFELILMDLCEGDANVCLFLSRVMYWDGANKRNPSGFYKSMLDWSKELHMPVSTARRCKDTLEKLGLISVTNKLANGSPTLHYKVNRTFLESELEELLPPVHQDSIEAKPSW